MPQKDNSVHQALTHLDRVNQLITTLRQLEDNEVAIAAVCRDELAHLTNTLTPTLLVRTVNRYRSVVEARLGKGHPALSHFLKKDEPSQNSPDD